VEIIDGDTLDFEVDLGFNITREMRVRLKGVDTAEIYGTQKESEEYQKGMKHKQYVAKWCDAVVTSHDGDQWPFFLATYRDETGKYGRYLAEIEARDGLNVQLPDRTDAVPVLTEALINKYGEEVNYDG